VFAVVGILTSEPIIWLAQIAVPKMADKATEAIFSNEFTRRILHGSEFMQIVIAALAVLVMVAPIFAVLYLATIYIAGRGSLKEGNRWLVKHATFAKGGTGGDLAAWVLGLGAGLLLESREILGISRLKAWTVLATTLILALFTRLSLDQLRRSFVPLQRWFKFRKEGRARSKHKSSRK